MLLRATTWALALSATASANYAHVIRRQDPPATPSAAPTESAAPIDPNAKGCAAVHLAYNAAAEGTEPSVKPSVALECLMSVPLDLERDIALIEWLLPYLSYQSTVGYLKKPPKGYLLPPVDIIGGALAIREKLRNKGYSLQYEFVLDIQRMLAATGDSHVTYSPALVSAISWRRTLNITSVSPDGLELPKIYDVNDVTSPGGSISDIESIDDKPIQEFLATAASMKSSQDPDAQFNELFWSVPGPNGVGFLQSFMPLPDAHTAKFSNGSTRVYENKAVIMVNFSAITSGEELHNVVEIPPDTPPAQAKNRRQDTETTVEVPPAVTQVPYYPAAVAVHYNGYMAGYFLNETTHPDTAVLAATDFIPQGERDITDKLGAIPEYLNTRKFLAEFFEACKNNGRTKLIIDLSANGGGLVVQGFEMYRTLFPNAKTWTGSRFRANAALNILGAATYGKPDEETVMSGLYLNPSTSQRYSDWGALYGPASFPEDKVSNLLGNDFSKPEKDETSGTTFLIAGSDPAYPLSQPFKAEDITILTDGKCASTCTVFVSLMVHEQKVRTIALGGRPLAQPMQALGGVKGCLVISFQTIYSVWNDIISRLKPSIPANLLPGLPTNATPPLMPIDMKANLNYRNAHLEKDPNGPPTHFLYEAANCRRFYKSSYLNDITTLWDDIAEVAWKGGKCAPGSTPDPEGKISDAVIPFSDNLKVFSQVSIYDGPGSQTNQEWLALAGKNMTGTTEGLSNGVGRVSGGVMGVAVAVVVAFVGLL
ncbi:hypothetical protein QBC34DRAFT_460296 [Podospora aff. communis PSN243]|uniref:Tail specific protease domain-containing protein n=1 Tax=Podospora aff. communis PSN243 TaxID=3040156 RepID=A0AAV9H433_9PEZI|nr:hypothetical protein QBC34DRAFT_460296 [Podospora aff. communis PSN243]